MKRTIFIALLVISSALALRAQSDSVKTPASLSEGISEPAQREIFVLGGKIVPYLPGETSKYWKSGWNGGVGYGLSFAPGAIGYAALAVVVEYNSCAFDPSGYRAAMTALYPGSAAAIQNGSIIARGPMTAMTAMLEFKGAFSPTKHSIAPYFLIGLGYMHFASDSIVIAGNSSFTVPENSQSGATWSFGLGIEVPFTSSFAMFVQGKSVLADLERTRQYFPVSGGFRITM